MGGEVDVPAGRGFGWLAEATKDKDKQGQGCCDDARASKA